MATVDFTTYVEVDLSGVLTVATSKITGVDCDRDIAYYVYKDYTANYFNALDIDFESRQESTTLNGGLVGVCGVSNAAGDLVSSWAATDPWCFQNKNASASVRFQITRGLLVTQDYYLSAEDTLYYSTMSRAAGNDSVSCLIYSDSGRTTLLDTVTIAGIGTGKYRYHYGLVGYKSDTAGVDWDGYSQNHDLNYVAPSYKVAVISHYYHSIGMR